jgi:hypothetical protein
VQLAAHLEVVLADHGVAPARRAALLAAVRGARDPRRTRALLLAHHPRRAAFIAAFTGHVTLHRDALLLADRPLTDRPELDRGRPEPGLTGARVCWDNVSRLLVHRYRLLAGRRPTHPSGAPTSAA